MIQCRCGHSKQPLWLQHQWEPNMQMAAPWQGGPMVKPTQSSGDANLLLPFSFTGVSPIKKAQGLAFISPVLRCSMVTSKATAILGWLWFIPAPMPECATCQTLTRCFDTAPPHHIDPRWLHFLHIPQHQKSTASKRKSVRKLKDLKARRKQPLSN